MGLGAVGVSVPKPVRIQRFPAEPLSVFRGGVGPVDRGLAPVGVVVAGCAYCFHNRARRPEARATGLSMARRSAASVATTVTFCLPRVMPV